MRVQLLKGERSRYLLDNQGTNGDVCSIHSRMSHVEANRELGDRELGDRGLRKPCLMDSLYVEIASYAFAFAPAFALALPKLHI